MPTYPPPARKKVAIGITTARGSYVETETPRRFILVREFVDAEGTVRAAKVIQRSDTRAQLQDTIRRTMRVTGGGVWIGNQPLTSIYSIHDLLPHRFRAAP